MNQNNVKDQNETWVTASEIGSAAFCPYQLYLIKQGGRVDRKTRKRMARGDRLHRQFNKQRKGVSSLGLFLLGMAALLLLAWYWVR